MMRWSSSLYVIRFLLLAFPQELWDHPLKLAPIIDHTDLSGPRVGRIIQARVAVLSLDSIVYAAGTCSSRRVRVEVPIDLHIHMCPTPSGRALLYQKAFLGDWVFMRSG